MMAEAGVKLRVVRASAVVTTDNSVHDGRAIACSSLDAIWRRREISNFRGTFDQLIASQKCLTVDMMPRLCTPA
jgi:hypothetical protein